MLLKPSDSCIISYWLMGVCGAVAKCQSEPARGVYKVEEWFDHFWM